MDLIQNSEKNPKLDHPQKTQIVRCLALNVSIVVNTSFKWSYGGSQVLVTGSFTGWKDHVPLQKVGNEFSTILVIS